VRIKSEIKPVEPSPDETRQQLLKRLARCFAEAGFRNATVREICRRAGANIAAVITISATRSGFTRKCCAIRMGKPWKNTRHCSVCRRIRPGKKLRAFVLPAAADFDTARPRGMVA